jgi:hypothetical protein
LLGVLVLLPLVRAVSWWYLVGSLSRHDPLLFLGTLYMPIHSHADGLIMGLLIANLELTGGVRAGPRFFATIWCPLAALVACAVLQKTQREVFNFSGLALVFGSAVWYLLSGRRAWLSWLNAMPFYWFSRLSFGMYLNHGYFFDHIIDFSRRYSPLAGRYQALQNIATTGVVFLISAALSLVTFCLVEYPFLRLRDAVLHSKGAGARESRPAGVSPSERTAPVHAPTPVTHDGVGAGSGPAEA